MDEANRQYLSPEGVANASLGLGFERTLPKLIKGTRLRAADCGRWVDVEVVRRCPGPVYWAKVLSGPRKGRSIIVSCSNYGGLVDVE